MTSVVLEGDNLGQKHKHHNKLVQETVLNKETIDLTLTGSEDDIQNLFKIDVACKTRNVDFLLEVLKSEDLLYVSRAINNCKWLITDKQYSHIVNPEYLHTQLSPEMTTKAFNKLMLTIRHNLKHEDRAEAFFMYIAEINRKAAYKWLQHCSVTFIENVVKKHVDDIRPFNVMLRLIDKSFSIFEIFMKTSLYSKYPLLVDTLYLAKNDPEKYLDVLETEKALWIKFSPKVTNIFMKKCPHRIIDKFEFYAKAINLATFVKHLEKQDIETFLLKHEKNEEMEWMYVYKYIVHFINHMSKESKFEFVKKVFIDKETFQNQHYLLKKKQAGFGTIYQWYKFAPFDVAFTELTQLIRIESSSSVRNHMIQIMLSCDDQNVSNIQKVLKYYHKRHINEPFKFKIQFVNTFISKFPTYEFDNETWDLLNQLFQSMEVYIESEENNTQSCIEAIIIRHVIRGETVPEIINNKFRFNTLKRYKDTLKKQDDKDAVFTFLYNYLVLKYDNEHITTQIGFNYAVKLCAHQLVLLNDWKKDLQEYPLVIKKLKDLVAIKQQYSWNTSMHSLYHVNKTWKKQLYNESMSLSPSVAVCINALKYDPTLLMRHKTEVDNLLKNNSILMIELLSKMRIYWPDMAKAWKLLYLNSLEETGQHNACIIGLSGLLTQKQLNDVAKKYAPSEGKIDWSDIDKITISLQKQIAKNISKARPLASLEVVLLYANGGYLQFAIPSLNSILSQLSANKIRKYIPTLLDAPVSLQKIGVRYAFDKLNSQELKTIFTEVWKSTKNFSIRTVIFTKSHEYLCKEKKSSNINDIWNMLSVFIDNLSTKENKLIYKKLGAVSGLPLSIQPQFFMKSYTFLKSLPAKNNCGLIIKNMETESLEIMEFLDDHFVVNTMLNNIGENLAKHSDNIYCYGRIIASFLLSCRDEETANRRYDLLLAPFLDQNLPLWYDSHNEKNYVKKSIKEILNNLLNFIREYNFDKNMYSPVKIFAKIQSKLETALSAQKDYILITSWKLAVEFIKLVDEHKGVIAKLCAEDIGEPKSSEEQEKVIYNEMHVKLAPCFAKSCIQLVKKDLESLHPTIFILFSKALEKFFDSLNCIIEWTRCFDYLKCILENTNDKEIYIMVYQLLPTYIENYNSEEEIEKLKDLRKILFSHPSEELKFYYYQLYDGRENFDDTK